MILDELGLLSDSQDLSQVAGTYNSTNVIDLKGATRKTSVKGAPSGVNSGPGEGTPIYLLCQVDEDFASGGAATLQVTLESDDDEAFGSATTVLQSQAFALADLIAGKQLLPQNLPYDITERYIRVTYTIGTATTTAGTVTTSVVSAIQTNG